MNTFLLVKKKMEEAGSKEELLSQGYRNHRKLKIATHMISGV
jgi:hypothetical protein